MMVGAHGPSMVLPLLNFDLAARGMGWVGREPWEAGALPAAVGWLTLSGDLPDSRDPSAASVAGGRVIPGGWRFWKEPGVVRKGGRLSAKL